MLTINIQNYVAMYTSRENINFEWRRQMGKVPTTKLRQSESE